MTHSNTSEQYASARRRFDFVLLNGVGCMIAAIAGLHLIGWLTLIVIIVPQHLAIGARTFDIGLGITAYVLGIRHALDADHIAAIDNTTRKLTARNERSTSVGFWFAIGHSSVVFFLTILFALGTQTLASEFFRGGSGFRVVTGAVGTLISGGFLYAIAALNMLSLVTTWRQYRCKRPGTDAEMDSEHQLEKRGLLNRLLNPLMKLMTKPWQMYFVGLLFGLGFDTVTEIALLVLSGTGAASGLPWYAILCLPTLFAAGMSIIDTIDGSFMNIAYKWAVGRPAGRIYYNLAITALSVTVALAIGTLETLELIADRLHLRGAFWRWIAAVDLNCVGLAIVGLFIFTWGVALLISKIPQITRNHVAPPWCHRADASSREQRDHIP
jgi:high-affinity nickel-transport protein